MERSFKKEVDALRLGAGDIFRGEGILAVTKALLQSGVSYVGGYQGAPVSHLLDVMVDAEDLLAELGVHVETCTNEAAAAAASLVQVSTWTPSSASKSSASTITSSRCDTGAP